MDGEGCRAACPVRETRSGRITLRSNRPRTLTTASGVVLPTWSCQFLMEASYEVYFHILNFHFLREDSHERFILRETSHESFVFTSSTFTFWGKRTKASLAHLQLSLFEGSLAQNALLRDSRCATCCVLQHKTCLGRWAGKVCCAAFFARRGGGSCFDHGSFPHCNRRFMRRFADLKFSVFEVSLARKLLFQIFQLHFVREVSHESFVFTSSVFSFWWKSRTKASFSHLQFSLLEGSLAWELRFHIFSFQFLMEVSHESFVFTSSVFTFGGKSRMRASFSHLQLSVFRGRLAWKLRFHIFSFFHFWAEVSHESFVFTSSTFISLALAKLNQVSTELWFIFLV